ncbi:hypothetical protein O181_130389 [Austropuccinia psidii MF-1]|uniref:Uncharacterized protein n=1 Tax=Austropuccinia psidii MF-1 TaxID=1389203 RepID=A0A9Q3QA22_9BASI|nr:hypothetical protein [Austropuccinia psidii MF-1]
MVQDIYSEFLVLGQSLAPWYPWVPSKIGPRGPPIAPTDRGLRCTVHRPRTVGPQKTEMAKKGLHHQITKKSPRTPKRPKRPWNQILSRFFIEEATSQDHHRGLFEEISKDNGDKTP